MCFGSPGSGSGSISQSYVSGSFYHQAKIVIKTSIPTSVADPDPNPDPPDPDLPDPHVFGPPGSGFGSIS
jgi:hypothetical protein